MPLKLKLSLSSAGITSATSTTPLDGNGENGLGNGNAVGPSGTHGNSSVGEGRKGKGKAVDVTVGTPTSAKAEHGNGISSSAHTGGAGTPTTAKRKKGNAAATGVTSRKSLGRPGQYSSKRQKLNGNAHDAPSTPISAHSHHQQPSKPSAIPSHVYSSVSTPVHSTSSSPMAPPPIPLPFPSPQASPSPIPLPTSSTHGSIGTTPPTPGGGQVWIKDEPFDGGDVDSRTIASSPDPLAALHHDHSEEAPQTPVPERGRTGGKVTRLRKPLKVIGEKVISDISKKDDYMFFSNPVDLDEFPNYLSIIGGVDKMMDLSTMQNKLENGEYRNMDDLEADFRLIVTNAETFNPPGTRPHASAGKLLVYGLKQIEKARPIVITPSPSPTRADHHREGTSWRGHSVLSGRDTTHPPFAGDDTNAVLPPNRYIPVEMLAYPPTSLAARAIGWNLNGGKRTYAKREIRAREKFTGKWRRWGVDGSREVDDMDDMDEVFYASSSKAPFGANPWTNTNRRVQDWQALAKRDRQAERSTEWEWQGYGGPLGQPPVPFTQFPLRPRLPERELKDADFGVGPSVEAEVRRAKARPWAGDIINPLLVPVLPAAELEAPTPGSPSKHQPSLPPPEQPRATYGNQTTEADIISRLFDEAMSAEQLREPYPEKEWHSHFIEPAGLTSGDWVREMMGGVYGQAYEQSLRGFVEGAIDSAEDRALCGDGADEPATNADKKRLLPEEKEGLEALRKYVEEEYNGGILSSGISRTVQGTIQALDTLGHLSAKKLADLHTAASASATINAKALPDDPLSLRSILSRAETANYRSALKYILTPSDLLDFAPLFRRPEEFFREGRQGKIGLQGAIKWVGQAIGEVGNAQQAAKRNLKGGSEAAEEAERADGKSAKTDPYARTFQLVHPYDPADDLDSNVIRSGADMFVVPSHQAGSVCARYPLIGRAAKTAFVPTSAADKANGTTDASLVATPDKDKMRDKQLYPADVALIRLEILTLAKHYALPGVKKFPRKEAERLLPVGIHKFLAEDS